ncbi:unnamed protein product [Lactuca virosa]|uniref:Purple acid phosphatase n=1 Tax=Lactuca virosa TaxID=75947 RepID=A0AAU9M5C9_9ASTR|nr:unnamed protein product [Lactuca virosa]
MSSLPKRDNLVLTIIFILPINEQPLAKIAIHKTVIALNESASIRSSPLLLGVEEDDDHIDWLNIDLEYPEPSIDDWVGIFSPAKLNASDCSSEAGEWPENPTLCTAPIKYKFAYQSSADYVKTGKAKVTFRIINQRSNFAFAFFTGGLETPKLVAVSNPMSFPNPKAPLYPRLAHGKAWDEMTVTWTSGYNIDEATPLVEWGLKGQTKKLSPAGTLTFTRGSMCGPPARTVGWRDPGFIHTSFLKDLWPNTMYEYRMGHMLLNGSIIYSKIYTFKSSPYPGQDSLQRVIIFGDMGKAERDGSNEYENYQPGSLITTDQLISDLDNYDIVFHIGGLPYASGYLSQWDQFTEQVEPISSVKPYMIASGNHERDFPNSGSFYDTLDSGGECGVLAQTMYYVPADNRAKFWYATDYGYSSNSWLADEGAFEEPMGRANLQKLWQKYKVDIALYGHVNNYERTCPIYQNKCVNSDISRYSGTVNGTIHVVVGGGGSRLSNFTEINTFWSLYKDQDWGFVKLTAFNHSSLLFEYKKSSDGLVYDSFTISRDYKDVLACVHDGCEPTTLAT